MLHTAAILAVVHVVCLLFKEQRKAFKVLRTLTEHVLFGLTDGLLALMHLEHRLVLDFTNLSSTITSNEKEKLMKNPILYVVS